jgi:rhodanese-related sulfurtransferase
MRKKIFKSIGIILCTTFIALVTNSFRADGLSLIWAETSSQQLSSGTEPGEGIISLQAFVKKLDQPGVIVLDARDLEDFREGHVPGAKSLPYDEFAEDSALVLQDIPHDLEVITYCEGVNCSLEGGKSGSTMECR